MTSFDTLAERSRRMDASLDMAATSTWSGDWELQDQGDSGRAKSRLAVALFTVLTVTPLGATSNVIPFPTYDVQTTRNWSSTGGFPLELTQGLATQTQIRQLRERSGLTWDELARLFGVSRRSVHNWATGTRLNSKHAVMLEYITALVDTHDAGEPTATRASLMTPSPGGISEYRRLRDRALDRTPTNPEGFTPTELLGGQIVPTPRGTPIREQRTRLSRT
jgi:transcriptional regulator with XRE-family HTH domain